jgi:ATP synthase F1 epsilon subunit
MANTIRLKVNTPAGTFFENDIFQIEIKTPTGYVAFLAKHAPMIGSFDPSIMYIRDLDGNRLAAIVNEGIFKVNNNEINVITDFFNFTNDLNVSILEERQKFINKALESSEFTKDISEYEQIQYKLQKQFNELKKIINKK